MRRRTPSLSHSTATLILLGILALCVFPFLAYGQAVKQVTVTCAKTQLSVPDSTSCSAKVRLSNGRYATNKTVKWISGTVAVATVSPTTGGTVGVRSIAGGTSTVSATADLVTGSSLLSVTGTAPAPTPPPPTPVPTPAPAPGEAELPRVYLTTTIASTPSTGRTLAVVAGGSLQAAYDSARWGDNVTVPACSKHRLNLSLAPKTSGLAGQWITIKSAGATVPEGTRISPAAAHAFATCSPVIISPNVNGALIAQTGGDVRVRIIGFEIVPDSALTESYGIAVLGDASSAQNTLEKVPSNIILDRVYVHAYAHQDARRCVTFNSARTALVDSYVSDCKSAFDAQAVTGTNGPGPFKIVNNYLEASGETIAWGGADPGIPNLVPSDIEIRGNHFFRPMSWRGKWLEKQIIESKNSSHVLVEANVMENSWIDGQYGWVVGLWSVNQQGSCTWCVTEHWTVRNNLIRNVTAGFSLTKSHRGTEPKAHHITIKNNLIIGLDNPAIQGYGVVFSIFDVPNLTIEHNTVFTPFGQSFNWAFSGPSGDKTPNQIIRNNLTGGGQYQIFSGYGQGSVAWALAADSASSQFAGNVVALYPSWFNPIPNNEYPATLADVGLAGGETAAYSVTAAPGDLSLAATSAFKGKGTDGKDPGADVPAILAATLGVVQSGALSTARAVTRSVPAKSVPRSTTSIPIKKP